MLGYGWARWAIDDDDHDGGGDDDDDDDDDGDGDDDDGDDDGDGDSDETVWYCNDSDGDECTLMTWFLTHDS